MNSVQSEVRLNFLRSAWTALGVLLVYLSLSFFGLSQQWPVKLPNAMVEKGDATPHGAALYALIACLPLFAVELALGWRYRVVSQAGYWKRRVPAPPLLENGDDRWPEWVLAQGGLLVAFHLLPGALLIYFLSRFLSGTAIVAGARISSWRHLWPPTGWSDAVGKYDPEGRMAPDYLRFWEPWLLCLLVVLCILGLGIHLRHLFRSNR